MDRLTFFAQFMFKEMKKERERERERETKLAESSPQGFFSEHYKL